MPVPSSVFTKSAAYTLYALVRSDLGEFLRSDLKDSWRKGYSGSYSIHTISDPACSAMTSYGSVRMASLSLARTKISLPTFTSIYITFSPTARATLPGNVHGVVVQARM